MELFWAVLAYNWCLIFAYFSPDSDEITFPLEKVILWIEDSYHNQNDLYCQVYEEFVFMTEATAAQQNDSDKTKNTDNKKKN